MPHGDPRGRFTEWYRADVLAPAVGLPADAGPGQPQRLGPRRAARAALRLRPAGPGEVRLLPGRPRPRRRRRPAGRLPHVRRARRRRPRRRATRGRCTWRGPGPRLPVARRRHVGDLPGVDELRPGRGSSPSPAGPRADLPWPADVELELSDRRTGRRRPSPRPARRACCPPWTAAPPATRSYAAALTTLHTQRWGADDAAAGRALLLPGITSSAATMWEVGEGLAAAGWSAVAVDLPGHGGSGPAASYRFADVADLVATQLGGGWDLVGRPTPWAAPSRPVLLAAHPATAARALLVDPALVVDDAAAADLLPQLQRDRADQTEDAVAAAHPHWHPRTVAERVRSTRSTDPAAVGAYASQNRPWDVRAAAPGGAGAGARAGAHRGRRGDPGPGAGAVGARAGRSRPCRTRRTRCTGTGPPWWSTARCATPGRCPAARRSRPGRGHSRPHHPAHDDGGPEGPASSVTQGLSPPPRPPSGRPHDPLDHEQVGPRGKARQDDGTRADGAARPDPPARATGHRNAPPAPSTGRSPGRSPTLGRGRTSAGVARTVAADHRE